MADRSCRLPRISLRRVSTGSCYRYTMKHFLSMKSLLGKMGGNPLPWASPSCLAVGIGSVCLSAAGTGLWSQHSVGSSARLWSQYSVGFRRQESRWQKPNAGCSEVCTFIYRGHCQLWALGGWAAGWALWCRQLLIHGSGPTAWFHPVLAHQVSILGFPP